MSVYIIKGTKGEVSCITCTYIFAYIEFACLLAVKLLIQTFGLFGTVSI